MTPIKTLAVLGAFATLATAAFAQPAVQQPSQAAEPRAAGGGHSKAEFIRTYDASGDSIVTRAEFDARRAAQYASTDADSRNSVSETEYVGEYTARLDRELAETRANQLRQAHVRFGVLDTNDDNAISADEFAASGTHMFGALDTNRDSSVDERDGSESY